MPHSTWLWIVNIGLLLVVAATALRLFSTEAWVRVIFSAGALAVLAGRLMAPKATGYSLRTRRLMRVEIWVGIMMCVAAFFMWYSPMKMDWLAFTMAGAALQVYASLAIPRAIAREKNGENGGKDVKK